MQNSFTKPLIYGYKFLLQVLLFMDIELLYKISYLRLLKLLFYLQIQNSFCKNLFYKNSYLRIQNSFLFTDTKLFYKISYLRIQNPFITDKKTIIYRCRQCWYLDGTCPWMGQSGTVPDLGQ